MTSKKIFKIIFLLIILISYSCHSMDNSDHNLTWKICEKLHVEKYTTFGMGAGGADMVGHCLTDSSSFRLYIGSFDEGYENITYDCQGDTLIIDYYSDEKNSKFFNKNKEYYSTQALKNLNNFNQKNYFRFRELIKISSLTSE